MSILLFLQKKKCFWKIIKVSIKEIELSIYMKIYYKYVTDLMSYVWYKIIRVIRGKEIIH